ncbi:MAG: class II aldolase/adducin family protein [Pseudomonadota bacterium]
MSQAALISENTEWDQPSANEQKTRVDVAACYRLMSLYGLTDLTDGFASCRVEGSKDEFIVGGYGLLPELARASDLYKRSTQGSAKLEKFAGVDIDAFNFTQAALTSRPEYNACIHAHSEFGVAFSALNCDFLPMTQYGIMFHGKIAYIDFHDTSVTSEQARDEIGQALQSGAEILILRNHGFLVPGRSMAQAFFHLYRIEQACRYQMRAMQTGAEIIIPNKTDLADVRHQYWTMTHIDNDGTREWPSLLAKLDRLDASYRH